MTISFNSGAFERLFLARNINAKERINKIVAITDRTYDSCLKLFQANNPKELNVTVNMKNMGMVTKVGFTFLRISHTEMVKRANAAKS